VHGFSASGAIRTRIACPARDGNPGGLERVQGNINGEEIAMGFGRGALLWLLGIPLPIILLLALFWR
jgi:hypothetical protein